MNASRIKAFFRSVVAGAAFLVAVSATEAASVTWGAWTFDYEVSGNFDGLSLKNVRYQGRSLLHKISMPVMRVFYAGDACGPYADRLGGTLWPIPWADNATIAQREFTLNGRQWYEIGIRDQIGNYDIYQVYYLSSDGILDAHIYSKGLQCVVDHIHYPNWRIDLDVDGYANDVIESSTGSAFQSEATEFDRNASTAAGHGWRVRDAATNLHVDLLPGFSDFSIPDGSVTVPVTDYAQNTVFGRLYRSTEDTGWTYGPNTQVPFNDAENIFQQDIVLWYEAYMPHSATDGSALWHSTGIRLVSSLTDLTPPTAPANLVAAAASTGQVQLNWTGSTDNVGVAGYLVERCPGAGCTAFVQIGTTVVPSYMDTGLTASTTYRYRVRATDAAGNLSVQYSNVASVTTAAPAPACTVSQVFDSISDNKVVNKLFNTGSATATLDNLVLNFPEPYLGIKEIKFGGASIFKSSSSVPPLPSGATIDSSGWTNTDASKRVLSPGTNKKLEIFFSKKWPKANCPNGSCLSGTASFTPGCQVGLGP